MTGPVRIVLKAGTHYTPGAHYASRLDRPAARPLKIEGEPGAVISAPSGDGTVLRLHELGWVVLEDLVLEGSEDPLRIEVDGDGSENVVIRRLLTRNAPEGECIRLYAATNVWIEDVETVGCRYGVRLLSVSDATIVRSTFRDAAGLGVSIEGGTTNVLVHGNTFRNLENTAVFLGGDSDVDSWIPGSDEQPRSEANDVYVVANVIESTGDGNGAVLFSRCQRCTVANNTIVDPQRFVARILDLTADTRPLEGRDGIFVNNLIVFDVADLSGYVNPDANPDALLALETYTFGWNLFVPDDPTFAGFTVPSPVPPDDTSQVVGADAARLGSDFRPQADSPAVGAGTAVDFGDFAPGDFYDNCWASPPTIGAHAAP